MDQLLAIDNEQLKSLLSFMMKLNDLLLKYRQQLQEMRANCTCSGNEFFDLIEEEYRDVVKEAEQMDLSAFQNVVILPKRTRTRRKRTVRDANFGGEETSDLIDEIMPNADQERQKPKRTKRPAGTIYFSKGKRRRGRPRKIDLERFRIDKANDSDSADTIINEMTGVGDEVVEEKAPTTIVKEIGERSETPEGVEDTPLQEAIPDVTEAVRTETIENVAPEVTENVVKEVKFKRKPRPDIDLSQFKRNAAGEFLGIDRPHHIIGQNNWICDYPGCEYRSRWRREVINHMPIHTGERLKCDECNKLLKNPTSLRKHKKFFHAEKKFKCDYPDCGKLFADAWYFEEHLKRHVIKQVSIKTLECPWPGCKFQAIHQVVIDNHVKEHFAEEGQIQADSNEDQSNSRDINNFSKTFTIKKSVKETPKKKTKRQRKLDGIDLSPYKRNEDGLLLGVDRPKNIGQNCWLCDFPDCNFKTPKRRLLLEHMPKHTGERTKCDECDKMLMHKSSLKSHKLTHHAEKKYACDEPDCDKKFPSRKKLEYHKNAHAGIKPFACHWPGCDYRAHIPSIVQMHMKKHSNDRPYVCEIDNCDLKFKTKCHLKMHQMKIHFNISPYKCSWPGCDKKYKAKPDLIRHEVWHSGEMSVSCDWPGCEYTGANKMRLFFHQKMVHKVGWTFSCTWPGCDKKLPNKWMLGQHLSAVHTGIKPIACQHPGCEQRFHTKGNMGKHYRMVHLGEPNPGGRRKKVVEPID